MSQSIGIMLKQDFKVGMNVKIVLKLKQNLDQFDKYSLNMIDHLGTKYDYSSVMHYAPTAFSKVISFSI